MEAVKKILMIIGAIAMIILWKTEFPESWDMFWSMIDSFISRILVVHLT